MSITIHTLTTEPDVAGHSRVRISYTAEVDGFTHCDQDTFVGEDHGTPGAVVWHHGSQRVYVTEPARFGPRFGEDWVRAFYTENAAGSPRGWVDSEGYCDSCERDNREGHYENCAR